MIVASIDCEWPQQHINISVLENVLSHGVSIFLKMDLDELFPISNDKAFHSVGGARYPFFLKL